MIHLSALLLVVVSFSCGCIVAEVCPLRWHRYNESCYFIIKNMVDWYEANRTCAESRANLGVPNSSSEQDYILKLFVDAFGPMVPSSHLWIGCNSIEEEGKWQHCPLRRETDSYENWKDDEPSIKLEYSQDCAIVWYPSGKWHNRQCSAKEYAVCELPISQTPVFCKQTGPDDRLTHQCLLHHAMKELSDRKSCHSRPSCHSFYLPQKK